MRDPLGLSKGGTATSTPKRAIFNVDHHYDHALILFSLEVMRPHAVRKTITFRSYRNVDNNSIVNDIEHILNVLDVSSLTAEDCTIWYNNFLNSLENKFCPLISKEILVKADAPWYDHTVAVLRRQHRRAERGCAD